MQSIRNLLGKKKNTKKGDKTGTPRPKSATARRSSNKSVSNKSRSSKRASAVAAPAGPPAAPVTNDKAFAEVYEMGKKLGQGNFSTVFAATRKRGGHPVAVKRITKRRLKQADVDAIFAESAILRRVDHPHIIRMYDFMEDDKYFYIVTELVQGGELFERIVAKEYYSERDAQQVCEHLWFMHTYIHTYILTYIHTYTESIKHESRCPTSLQLH
jgi:serine/threonine protein kinase